MGQTAELYVMQDYKFSYLACKTPLGAREIGQPWLRHWAGEHGPGGV